MPRSRLAAVAALAIAVEAPAPPRLRQTEHRESDVLDFDALPLPPSNEGMDLVGAAELLQLQLPSSAPFGTTTRFYTEEKLRHWQGTQSAVLLAPSPLPSPLPSPEPSPLPTVVPSPAPEVEPSPSPEPPPIPPSPPPPRPKPKPKPLPKVVPSPAPKPKPSPQPKPKPSPTPNASESYENGFKNGAAYGNGFKAGEKAAEEGMLPPPSPPKVVITLPPDPYDHPVPDDTPIPSPLPPIDSPNASWPKGVKGGQEPPDEYGGDSYGPDAEDPASYDQGIEQPPYGSATLIARGAPSQIEGGQYYSLEQLGPHPASTSQGDVLGELRSWTQSAREKRRRRRAARRHVAGALNAQ